MNKIWKKAAALAAAGMMTVALALPAYAAPASVGTDNGPAITQMAFDKKVQADANTYLPNATIKFTVAPATVTDGETYDNQVVKAGLGTITADDVSVKATDKGDTTYASKFNFAGVIAAGGVTQPGIYKYTVTETDTAGIPDMKEDAAKTLYVYTRWNAGKTGVEVYGAAMTKVAGNSTDQKTGEFVNEFKNNGGEDDPDPNTPDPFKDLTITKQVAGSLGDTDQLFDFTLTLTSGSGRTTYVVSTTANGSAATLTAGTPYTFKLKHGEKIVVENLSSSDTYTIDEVDSTATNYVVTGEVTNAKAMAKTDVTETITNTRNAVTPTGILMDYAPYILMIGAVGVFGLVFFRRRRRDEV